MPRNPLKELKDLVSAEAEKRNWSQRELALKAGLSPQALNLFLGKPEADLKLTSLLDIAKALDVPPGYLLDPKPAPPPSVGDGVTQAILERIARLEAAVATKPTQAAPQSHPVHPQTTSERLNQLVPRLATMPEQALNDLLDVIEGLLARQSGSHGMPSGGGKQGLG